MIATLLLALQAAAAVPVTEIESTKTTESEMMPAAGTSRAITTLSAKNVRIEQVEGGEAKMPGAGPGTYMLMLGDTKKMYTVDPSKKEYFEIDLAKMQSQLGAMLKAMPGMEMKFSDLDYRVEDLGDGETLLGHPTRRFKIHSEITMSAATGSDTMSISMSSTAETYYARDLPMEGPDMMSMGDTSMLRQFGDLIPGVNAAMVREQVKKLPRLLALKTVTNVVSYFGAMDVTATMTDLVTRVEKKQVPAAIFTIPAGYRKVEMPEFAGPKRQ